MTPPALSLDDYVSGVESGDRRVLAQAITLNESRRAEDQVQAQELLVRLMPRTGQALRVGISGVPGAGKSTFIENLGMRLLEQGRRVAVLAVDPSSSLTGGSILGDKSRMPRLANDERAYVRPSPSSLFLGGVTRRTRESMLLCEAAGFDVVLVETVGVGQSETVVADMVDCFLVLLLPGAGDELQGIKKGILELADILAVNKADGDNVARAQEACREYRAALRYIRPRSVAWNPPVLALSARTGEGLPELWATIEEHRKTLEEAGDLEQRRQEQRHAWLWSVLEDRLLDSFRSSPAIQALLATSEAELRTGKKTAVQVADELIAVFRNPPKLRPPKLRSPTLKPPG